MGEGEAFGVDADGEERKLFGVGGHVEGHEEVDVDLAVVIGARRFGFLGASQRALDVLRDVEDALRWQFGREFQADIAELVRAVEPYGCGVEELRPREHASHLGVQQRNGFVNRFLPFPQIGSY